MRGGGRERGGIGNTGQGRRREEGCVECGAGMGACWRVWVYAYGKEDRHAAARKDEWG